MYNEQDIYDKLRPPKPTPDFEICGCLEQQPIKLMSTFGYNPIHCLACNLEVPPERLSLQAKLADVIAFWAQVHRALDYLWIDADYENWAEPELADINSAVNRRGREIARALNELRRCYYWYHQDQTVAFWQPITDCPVCGKELTKYVNGIFEQRCSLVTGGE